MKPISPYRLMLWLKWTLTWRGYRKNKLRVLGMLFFLLAFLPVSFGIAGFLWWFLHADHSWMGMAVTRDVLAAIYALWVLSPLLGFQMNESYDLTKLFVYPLSYRQIFIGSILGNITDHQVLLVLPSLLVLLIVYSASLAGFALNVLLLFLFLLHTIALSQAIMLTLVGFLRSRRFRDITIVVLPVFALLYYVGQQTFVRQISREGGARFLDNPLWHIADLLPPGYAASGLSAVAHGNYSFALIQIYGLLSAGILATALAATALRRLYLGDTGPQNIRSAVRKRTVDPIAKLGMSALSRLPMEIAAVASKEFIYFRREPQYKAMAVQIIYTLIAIAVPILVPSLSRLHHHQHLQSFAGILFLSLGATLLLSFLPLLFNIFGGEGAAITVLFSLPTNRRSVLLGKNLAHASALLVVNGIGLALLAAVSRSWEYLPIALVWVVISTPLLLGTGNLISIRFPHKLLIRGQRWQRGGVAAAGGDGTGCLYTALYLTGYLATFVVLLPALAAVILPGLQGIPKAWYMLSLPLGFFYSIAIYRLLLGYAERWLLTREPEITAMIVPVD